MNKKPHPGTKKENEVEKDQSDTEPVPTDSESSRPDPTRYGDWEKGGRCIDFCSANFAYPAANVSINTLA
tara:strand:+ start:167 stop:376 length:210 start_codon:yes stop_codon:yes gene_type:complete